MFISVAVITWCPVVFCLLYVIVNYLVPGRKSVAVVVLGDIGRSPRMQYHATSFAKEGFNVDLVGYGGSKPHENIQKSNQIFLHEILEPPQIFKYFPRLISYVLKVLWQCLFLGLKLLLLPKSWAILLQNPPSIPTMAVCWIVCLFRGSTLVIDWHNYGYTILGLTLGDTHLLVRFSKWYEHFFGRFSKHNFSVTDAMKKDLEDNWNIKADTLYDRPSEMFKQTAVEDAHDLFTKLSQKYDVFTDSACDQPNSTAFTEKQNKKVRWRDDRPCLVISSTSWTEDEDFGILLTSLQEYDRMTAQDNSLPHLVCIITGKGPLKEFYKKRIEDQRWNRIKFCLPWLEAEDYPKLLGAADLGICLHKSSSGLDLPMKVVDMFGCGVPVCALQFECISELVKHNQNGLIFEDSQELCQQLKMLLCDFTSQKNKLTEMRDNLKSFQANRWHTSWRNIVLPVFLPKSLKSD